eukprot:6203380-Pleurochrysis_carterae.AAC.1
MRRGSESGLVSSTIRLLKVRPKNLGHMASSHLSPRQQSNDTLVPSSRLFLMRASLATACIRCVKPWTRRAHPSIFIKLARLADR